MIYKGKVMSSFIVFARSVATKQSPRPGREIASSGTCRIRKDGM